MKLPKPVFSSDQRLILINTKNFVQDIYKKGQDEKIVIGGHLFDHSQRVSGMIAGISILESKDPFLPVLSSLMHDIGRANADPRSHTGLHGQLSREMVTDFIRTLSLSEVDQLLILDAIEDHPFLNDKVRRTWLVELLMDADRLDRIGAKAPLVVGASFPYLPILPSEEDMGKGLATSWYGHIIRIEEWVDMLWTDSAKKVAAGRVGFQKEYIDKMVKEERWAEEAYKNLNLD